MQGRVHDVAVGNGGLSISASVRGSRAEPYRQTITLSPTPEGRAKIEGYCNCPMGFNCKHVAAVLFEALAQKRRTMPRSAAQERCVPAPPATVVPIQPSDPALPFEVSSWLDQVIGSTTNDDFPPEISQRLVYVFTPHTAPNSNPHLSVDILTARLLKSGAFSPSITRPGLSNFYLGNWPRYFRSSDIEICQALIASRGGYNPGVYPLKAFSLWTSIVATGRAYWQNHSGATTHPWRTACWPDRMGDAGFQRNASDTQR